MGDMVYQMLRTLQESNRNYEAVAIIEFNNITVIANELLNKPTVEALCLELINIASQPDNLKMGNGFVIGCSLDNYKCKLLRKTEREYIFSASH